MKVGEFVYPWGSGHYTRMVRLNEALEARCGRGGGALEAHVASGPPTHGRLLERYGRGGGGARYSVHEVRMPTPIDGRLGPSVSRSLLNVLLPVSGRAPLVSQIAGYLREERKIYDSEGFDLVINDGDMGSNVLARNRGIPSLFVTNQFMPRLWRSRAYFYPLMRFVAGQIAKADRILVADSPPPYTMCEYNLNFPGGLMDKVAFVGHFAGGRAGAAGGGRSDLARLVEGADYGYWMRTGNASTNEGTGRRYEEAFRREEMRRERRVVSHARRDPSIDAVTGTDGRRYAVREALEKGIDWIQIDVGFLTEEEKGAVMGGCKYAVVNGSHTVMGEVMGAMAKPIVGVPVYDEHTNQIRWAEERSLGVLAGSPRQIAGAVAEIRGDYGRFEEGLADFSRHFDGGGAAAAAGAAAEMLEKR